MTISKFGRNSKWLNEPEIIKRKWHSRKLPETSKAVAPCISVAYTARVSRTVTACPEADFSLSTLGGGGQKGRFVSFP